MRTFYYKLPAMIAHLNTEDNKRTSVKGGLAELQQGMGNRTPETGEKLMQLRANSPTHYRGFSRKPDAAQDYSIDNFHKRLRALETKHGAHKHHEPIAADANYGHLRSLLSRDGLSRTGSLLLEIITTITTFPHTTSYAANVFNESTRLPRSNLEIIPPGDHYYDIISTNVHYKDIIILYHNLYWDLFISHDYSATFLDYYDIHSTTPYDYPAISLIDSTRVFGITLSTNKSRYVLC